MRVVAVSTGVLLLAEPPEIQRFAPFVHPVVETNAENGDGADDGEEPPFFFFFLL